MPVWTWFMWMILVFAAVSYLADDATVGYVAMLGAGGAAMIAVSNVEYRRRRKEYEDEA